MKTAPCKVNTIGAIGEKEKEQAGHDLVMAYSMFCDIVNNNYIDQWNDEWYEKHPELKDQGMPEGSQAYIDYGVFWEDKCNDIFGTINGMMPKSTIIAGMKSIEGNPVILGQLKSDKSKYVFLGK